MRLFFLFLTVPLIEIALFIQVGGAIGLAWTLIIVILTAILGTMLVRSQGLAVLNQIRGALDELKDPTEPLIHGAMILFSGALLLTPGFFTDIVGFALLMPGVRTWVFKLLRSRIQVAHASTGRHRFDDPEPDIIDADFEDLDPPRNEKRPSGWTQH